MTTPSMPSTGNTPTKIELQKAVRTLLPILTKLSSGNTLNYNEVQDFQHVFEGPIGLAKMNGDASVAVVSGPVTVGAAPTDEAEEIFCELFKILNLLGNQMSGGAQ